MIFEFTENNIADLIVINQKRICTSYDLLVPKCYTTHDNECDVFAIRKSGLCDEFEIKVSRSDFLNDAKKKIAIRESRYFGTSEVDEDRLHYDKRENISHTKWKKLLAPWEKMKYQALVDGDTPVNYFWYVVKYDIVEICDLPKWAGLIKIFDDGSLRVIKSPEKLHRNKVDDAFKFNIARKLGFRYWDNRLS